MLNPGLTFCTLIRLRRVSPAAMSSMNDALTWPTISTLRTRWLEWLERPPSRSAGATSMWRENAGIDPKISPVSTETPSVNIRTVRSMPISLARGPEAVLPVFVAQHQHGGRAGLIV